MTTNFFEMKAGGNSDTGQLAAAIMTTLTDTENCLRTYHTSRYLNFEATVADFTVRDQTMRANTLD